MNGVTFSLKSIMPFTQQQTNNPHTNQLQETSNSCSSRSWRIPRKGDSCGKSSSSSPWSTGVPSGTARSRFFSQDRRRPFSHGDSFGRDVINPPGFRGRAASREQELRAARAKASREMAEEQERRREARKQQEANLARRREAADAVKTADHRVQELKTNANVASQALHNLNAATQRAAARRAEEIKKATSAAKSCCQPKAKGTLQARVMEKKRQKRLAMEEEKARKTGTLDQLLTSRAAAEAEKVDALSRPQCLRALDVQARLTEQTALDQAKQLLDEATAALAEAVAARAAAQLRLEQCTPAQDTAQGTTKRSAPSTSNQAYQPPVAANPLAQPKPKNNFFQTNHPNHPTRPSLATAPQVRRNFDVCADGPAYRNATQDEEGRWWLRSKGKVRELRQDPVDPKKGWYTLEQVKKYYRSHRKWSLEKTLDYWKKEMAPKKPKKEALDSTGPVRQLKIINGKPKLVVVQEASPAPQLPNPNLTQRWSDKEKWRPGAAAASAERTFRYHSPDVRALPVKPRAPVATKPSSMVSEKLGSWRRAGA